MKIIVQSNKSIVSKIIIVFAFLLTACLSDEKNEPLVFDEDFLNQQISIKAPEFFNTYKTTDAISFEIRNNSPYEIIFPNDYNIMIFSWENNQWKEIYEIPPTRLPEGNFTLSPKINSAVGKNIFVLPDLPNHNQEYDLRVYIFGEAKKDGEIIVVGAYTNITLHP